MPQSIRICPNCKNEATLYIIYDPKYQERFICENCGNFYLLTKVRDVTNLRDDYGKYQFISCLDPWGYVEVHLKNGDIIKNAVSLEESYNFTNWVETIRSDIKYVKMSYMDVDRKIKTKLI